MCTEGPDKDLSPQHTRCLMIAVFASGLSAWWMSQQQTHCLRRRQQQHPPMWKCAPWLPPSADNQSCDQGGHEKKHSFFTAIYSAPAMCSHLLTGSAWSALYHVVCVCRTVFRWLRNIRWREKASETFGCLILVTLELCKSLTGLFLLKCFDKVLPRKSRLVCKSKTGLRRKHSLKKNEKISFF